MSSLPLPLDLPLEKSPQAVFQESPDGGVVLHLQSGAYFGVNRVGAFVWSRVDGAATAADLAQQTAREFPDADAASVRDDVVAYLGDLAQRELLTWAR